jgi:hypothetical protein
LYRERHGYICTCTDPSSDDLPIGLSTPLSFCLQFQWLRERANAPDLFCLVIFRGSWCKYDKYYLRSLGKFLQSKIKSGLEEEEVPVSLVAWTSQGAKAAKEADVEWGLTKDYGFKQVLGDDTNALANYLVEDYILADLVTKSPAEVAAAASAIGAPPDSYPSGMVMPAVLWYAHHGSAPVFEWTHKAADGGCGGALRPDPEEMWKLVLKRKSALDNGNAVMPSHGANVKMCATELQVNSANCDIV